MLLYWNGKGFSLHTFNCWQHHPSKLDMIETYNHAKIIQYINAIYKIRSTTLWIYTQ